MNQLRLIMALLVMLFAVSHATAQKYVGGDLSLLSKYEQQSAQYKDKDGNAISDLLTFVKQQGWNTIRVRLFVDPVKGQAITSYETNKKEVVQDLEYVKALGHRIKAAGLYFMLDFHYSDTYADPQNQWTPDDWKSLTDDQLKTKVYEYTLDCLDQLNEADATPDLIQTGNEISYGMLWGTKAAVENKTTNRCYTTSATATWTRFTDLLKQASKACREKCPNAKIIVHSERTPNPSVLVDFLNHMKSASLDYDVIGLSYYPYYHGELSVLKTALNTIVNKNYGKEIQIVETGYPSKWTVPGSVFSVTPSVAKQKQHVIDLISALNDYSQVTGLLWWWAEANAKGCTGDLKNGWYNAGLFDNETGKALDALYEMKAYCVNDTGIETTVADGNQDNDAWYTMDGRRLNDKPVRAGLYIRSSQGKSSAQKIHIK